MLEERGEYRQVGVYQLWQWLQLCIVKEAVLADIQPLKAIWVVCLSPGSSAGLEAVKVRCQYNRLQLCDELRTLGYFWESRAGTVL